MYRLISILLWTIICPLASFATQSADNALFDSLNIYIDKRDIFIDQKEQRINILRSKLDKPNNDQFQICINLFDEYKSYLYDSAYIYAERSLSIAEAANDKANIIRANDAMVFCLLSSGLFKEAFEIAEHLVDTDIPKEILKSHYMILSRLYYDMADYNREGNFVAQYIIKGGIYSDSLLSMLPKESSEWWYIMGQKQMKTRKYEQAKNSFIHFLESDSIDAHSEAIIASSLGFIYWANGDKNRALHYLLLAAIGDIRSATKETTALRSLSAILYEQGDLNKAEKYIKIAMDDANFYNARHRKIEVGSILPDIETDRFDIMKHQRNILIILVMAVSLLFISLLIATVVIYKQINKLRRARNTIEERNRDLLYTNNKLEEVNNIKDEYIGYSFYLNSESIVRLEKMYKMINRKIQARQYDDLQQMFREADILRERETMYESFDQTFLKLFPTFITSYKKLFPPDTFIDTETAKTLTPEMRIFALIRLGITESERIANFLNYSVNTINTYKTKVKNKSIIPNEKFESIIMEIQSVTKE